MEGGLVGFDVAAVGLPRGEATAKKLDALVIRGSGLLQGLAGGLVTGTGAVEDHVAVEGDEIRVSEDLFGRDADAAGDDVRVGEQVERVTNVQQEDRLRGCEQRSKLIC